MEINLLKKFLHSKYPHFRYPLLALGVNTAPFNKLLKRENYSDIDHMIISRDKERTVIIEFKFCNGRNFNKQHKAIEGLCFKNIVVWCYHKQEMPWNIKPETVDTFEIWHEGNCSAKGNGYPSELINKWLEGESI